jgi:hypothetical protein
MSDVHEYSGPPTGQQGWGPEEDQPEQPPAAGRNPIRDLRLAFVIGVLVLVVVFVVALVAGAGDSEPSRPAVPASSVRTVTYEVVGSARSVDVTMRTPSGTSQQSSVDVPLTRKGGGPMDFQMPAGSFAYLSAQNNGRSGTVTCRIRIGVSRVVSEVSSSGEYVIATCSGTVP